VARRIQSHPPNPELSEQLFPEPYVEPLSEARTMLAAFFNILAGARIVQSPAQVKRPHPSKLLTNRPIVTIDLHGKMINTKKTGPRDPFS
jgi:hypothetical protein